MDKFEGPEKKLEIILSDPQTGLRDNTDGHWARVVRASGAEILKHKYSENLNSYLLSESSLFVSDDHITMITCGRTTPVKALPVILQYIDTGNVAYVIYRRKNLNFPDEQPTEFSDDLVHLLKYFPGTSIQLGPDTRDHIHVFCYAKPQVSSPPDATLQVLMHGIDPSVSRTFYIENNDLESQRCVLSRLNNLYPAMHIDNHFFYPQGYSLNGISDKSYFTIHVSPQPEASYASFESNILDEKSAAIIAEVISIFNPKRYSLVLTPNGDGHNSRLTHDVMAIIQSEYQAMDQISHAFNPYYTTIFSNFIKRRQ